MNTLTSWIPAPHGCGAPLAVTVHGVPATSSTSNFIVIPRHVGLERYAAVMNFHGPPQKPSRMSDTAPKQGGEVITIPTLFGGPGEVAGAVAIHDAEPLRHTAPQQCTAATAGLLLLLVIPPCL